MIKNITAMQILHNIVFNIFNAPDKAHDQNNDDDKNDAIDDDSHDNDN